MTSEEMEIQKNGQEWASCDGDVRDFVLQILELVDRCLGGDLKGIVLHGSLATGAFHRPKSDVDILVISKEGVTDQLRADLWSGLLRVSDDRPLLGDIELSIVRSDVAAKPSHPMPYEFRFNETLKDAIRAGQITHDDSATDEDLAPSIVLARGRGISLFGPAPGALIGEVAWKDYVTAIQADFDWIVDKENIVETPIYGVLNICRILLVLTAGKECAPDKEEGALWGIENLPSEHLEIIESALEAYRDPDELLEPTADSRRQGGRQWSKHKLLAFRDFARAHYRVLRS